MLVWASALSVVAIVNIVGYLLVREYRNTEDDAARSALNIVQLISRDIRNTISTYDSALNSLVSLVQSQALASLSPQTQQPLLFDRAAEAPSNAGFFVLDADGKVIAGSRPVEPLLNNARQQSWFKVHLKGQTEGIFISRPLPASDAPNDWSLVLSRRITTPDGRFGGVAVALMKMSYFQNLFRGLDLGPKGNISLVSSEGIMLIQYPATTMFYTGQDLGHTPIFLRFLTERHGSFTAVSGIYHLQRLYNFAQISELPLLVVVALSTEHIFSNWRHTALLIGSATLLLCLGLLWLTWLLVRELRLRQRAEGELAALAAT
ncbi:deoxyribonuclease, partial [Pseudomonas sp. FSL R10-1339]|nr:deoxyribonuclease [Pseudomonas sp. FSL R10-1339]